MRPAMKWLLRALAVLVIAGGVAACTDEDGPPPQRSDEERRNKTVDQLIQDQPAETMNFSPSRETINFWISTWGQEPGKPSFVYLVGANGEDIGYYVLEGLPVSYCASVTRNYQVRDGSGDTELVTPAPGVDGVWYSGGQCNVYYGRDATTGAYIEYTVGQGTNVLLYDQPQPREGSRPLGDAVADEVEVPTE
jgi:hypothetical protein